MNSHKCNAASRVVLQFGHGSGEKPNSKNRLDYVKGVLTGRILPKMLASTCRSRNSAA